jgi:hypothetical protein
MEQRCWRCAAVVASHERFCAACGAGLGSGTSVQSAPARLGLDALRKVSQARKWLLAISILTLVGGLVFYGLQRHEVENNIRNVAAQTAAMAPAMRDQLLWQRVGMTWAEVVKHDRGMVKLLLGLNVALAAIYLGLFFWARRNELAATVIALGLFVTVIAVSAALDPTTLAYGIPIKIAFIAVLVTAITAALRERKHLSRSMAARAGRAGT